MPPAGFEPAIPASERPQTHALDSAATGIGDKDVNSHNIVYISRAKFSPKSRRHPRILGARWVRGNKFCTAYPQILGISVQNSVARAPGAWDTCIPDFRLSLTRTLSNTVLHASTLTRRLRGLSVKLQALSSRHQIIKQR
jgi:hypothetical protein